jgi:exodeoxyribonuclease VII small subunit
MSTGKDQKKSIEKSLTELERLVEELENGDLELDQALKKFEQGVKLSRECQKTLEEAEMKIKILMDNALKATDEELN